MRGPLCPSCTHDGCCIGLPYCCGRYFEQYVEDNDDNDDDEDEEDEDETDR